MSSYFNIYLDFLYTCFFYKQWEKIVQSYVLKVYTFYLYKKIVSKFTLQIIRTYFNTREAETGAKWANGRRLRLQLWWGLEPFRIHVFEAVNQWPRKRQKQTNNKPLNDHLNPSTYNIHTAYRDTFIPYSHII